MTVLVSGHILAEMELIADTVGIIKKGRILKEVPLEVIHEYNKEYIELEVDNLSRTGYLIEERLGIKNYKIVSENKMRVYDLSKKQSTISKILVENGVELESIYRKEGTLEGYFLKLIEEDSYAAAN
jgi:ABC-2 type transport system ATP-binding protein